MLAFPTLATTGASVGPPPLALILLAHAPYALLVLFILAGVVERIGYFFCGRTERRPGRLPLHLPHVCVQLPMYNEEEVAARAIDAACRLRWPRDRLEVQVLDDSSSAGARAAVDAAVARHRAAGVNVYVVRRSQRKGYKAGALENGRKLTSAPYLALFDADFVPRADFLERTLPHFFGDSGEPLKELALVQASWAHINPSASAVTQAQSLWIDDHHILQMNWRAAAFGFVNFTGTAGVWRAGAIHGAGGWSGRCLVEDCELSFRILFRGYRTTFVNEPVPAELPDTFVAYRAQQRRWTMGWAQLIRLHAVELLTGYRCRFLKRCHLTYQMFLSAQWPLWMLWQLLLPLIYAAGLQAATAGAVYVWPPLLYMCTMGVLTSLEASLRHQPDTDAPDVAGIGAGVDGVGSDVANGIDVGVNGVGVNGVGVNDVDVGVGVKGVGANGFGVNGVGVNGVDGIGVNGVGVNGVGVNGDGVNGVGVNGVGVNGVGVNGVGVNGVGVNGVGVNGVNGVGVNGVGINGVGVDGVGVGVNGVDGVSMNGVGANGVSVAANGLGGDVGSRGSRSGSRRWRGRLARARVFWRSLVRVVPCMLVSSGMLAHQTCAWFEGLATESGVFERTPKTGTTGGRKTSSFVATPAPAPSRPRGVPAVLLVEVCFVLYLVGWSVHANYWGYLHLSHSVGALYQAATVMWVCVRSTWPTAFVGGSSVCPAVGAKVATATSSVGKSIAAASPVVVFSYFARCRRAWCLPRIVDAPSLYESLHAEEAPSPRTVAV